MARPERNTVDYFPFLCKEGKAMYYIENKYGNNGYASWIKILRQLAVTNNHFLDLSDKVELMFLASKCKIEESMLESIILDLSKLQEFDEKIWIDYKIIWSDKFIENIQDAYKKRNNKCVTKDFLISYINSKSIPKPSKSIPKPSKSIPKPSKSIPKVSGNTHSIVYNTISDNSIVDNTIVNIVEQKSSTYSEMCEIYNSFCKEKIGVGGKFGAKEGKAMKSIIAYLKTNVKDKENSDEATLNAWKLILTNVDKWDKFHQTQLTINQIDSNLINILNAIRNEKQITKERGYSQFREQD